MKHIVCISFFALLMIGCDNAPRPPIQMSDFINDVPVKKLGKRLINLPYGLNALEPMEEGANEIFIAVHGGGSEEASNLQGERYVVINRSVAQQLVVLKDNTEISPVLRNA